MILDTEYNVCEQQSTSAKMNRKMKSAAVAQNTKKPHGTPYTTIRGTCRDVDIFRYPNGKRFIFQIFYSLNGVTKTKSTTNKKNICEFATVLANLPLCEAATLLTTPLPVLREVANSIQKLKLVLEPLNLSVASGIEEYAAVKTKAGQQDLRELFADLLNKVWVERCKTPIQTVVERFLEARKTEAGVSEEYYKTLYYTLGKVVEQVGQKTPIGAVTTEQLKPIVFKAGIVKRSQKTYRTNVRTLFKWCQLNQYLDYSQPTAADALERIKVGPATPDVLKVVEARAIFAAVEHPWYLLYLVFSAFTAIRHDELQRLTWDLIKPGEHIEIPVDISKTDERRVIPMQPALHAWLRPFYGRQGLVMPLPRVQEHTRQFLQKLNHPNIPKKWKRNILRQSYCSYRLAQTGKVLQTAAEDGHSASILERVYLKLSSQMDAEAFFTLTPEVCGKIDWECQVAIFLGGEKEVHSRQPQDTSRWKPIGGTGAAETIATSPAPDNGRPRYLPGFPEIMAANGSAKTRNASDK